MKPRLTKRVLLGLMKACAKAESEMDADEDQHEDLAEVLHARKWVEAMIDHRENAADFHRAQP